MKFVGEYKEHLFTSDGAVAVTFTANGEEKGKARQIAEEMRTSLTSAKEAVKYEISIKKYSPKRSVNANDYCWKLLSELAKKLSKTKGEITKEALYKQYILDFGSYDEVWAKNEVADSVIHNWQCKNKKDGIGWLAEKITVGEKVTTIWLYPGSSSFDIHTMFEFTLAIVNDCKLEGIETRTPNEIAQMEGIRPPRTRSMDEKQKK